MIDGSLPASYVRSTGLRVPKIEELMAAGRAEFDQEKRRAIYTEMQKIALEQVPIVGLGSSATFSQIAKADDVARVGEVFKALVSGGGRVFDTAPGYGASEEVSGRVAADLGLTDRIWWATKVNVAGFGRGSADPGAARKQIEQSFARIL